MEIESILHAIIIPLLGIAGYWLSRIGKQLHDNLLNSTRSQALKTAAGYAYTLVQYGFEQIIKPAWERYKADPKDFKAKEEYEQALKTAKGLASQKMKEHIQALPDVISSFLMGKIDELIETAIPEAKRVNKNPTAALEKIQG